ncbi:MAG: pyridoxamine 5'-phosphate oxidase family protein [Thermodesulfovibrionales bacterium]
MGKLLRRDELERSIIGFLMSHSTCVLATCGESGPRASTVEYFPQGLTLFILTEGGRKIANIRQNPEISLAVSSPFAGWDSVRGIQLSGTAEIGEKGSEIFRDGEEAFRKRRGLRGARIPDTMLVIRITPRVIEYLDMELCRRGGAPRQVFQCGKERPA